MCYWNRTLITGCGFRDRQTFPNHSPNEFVRRLELKACEGRAEPAFLCAENWVRRFHALQEKQSRDRAGRTRRCT
jgi:hypothetical protein